VEKDAKELNMLASRTALRRVVGVAAAVAITFMASALSAYAASWQIVASPNPTVNDGFATLTAVSPTDIWAVGSDTNQNSSGMLSATMIANYNGSSWQVVPSPNPSGSRYNYLNGVSATSASDIWAVGSDYVSKGTKYAIIYPTIEHYNGSAWSLVTSAEPTQVGVLEGVAAVTPADVWAVGSGRNSAGVSGSMIQHWDGASWTEVSSPVTGVTLTSVTATSATDVWAVGYTASAGVAMHYDGTSWTTSTLPAPSGGGWQLSSVSADAAGDVWAAGYVNGSGSAQHPIVEHFDGTSWSVTQAPDLGSAYPANWFTAVLAISPGNVWAIGGASPLNETNVALVEHFDGTSWTVQPSPANGANSAVSFGGLATTGSGTLWAVGERLPNGVSGAAAWQTDTARYS
jgi:hypothetical protein